jgi:hypothetical protein
MAAINRVQYHPPPPISFCEGPRIIQKLKDVVVQILELPLYISILFASTQTEAESKEKHHVWYPMPDLTITSPYVHFVVDYNTFTMGMPESTSSLNAMPETTSSPCHVLEIWPQDYRRH